MTPQKQLHKRQETRNLQIQHHFHKNLGDTVVAVSLLVHKQNPAQLNRALLTPQRATERTSVKKQMTRNPTASFSEKFRPFLESNGLATCSNINHTFL